MNRGIIEKACLSLALVLSSAVQANDLKLVARYEQQGKPIITQTLVALRQAGFSPTVDFMPWSRAFEKAVSGQADMLIGVYKSTEREEKLQYTQQIGKVEVVIVKKQGIEIDSLSLPSSLEGHRIGMLRGGRIGGGFDDYLSDYDNLEFVADSKQNLDKLLKTRIDLFFEKRSIAQRHLDQLALASNRKIDMLLPPVVSNGVFNGISRQNAEHQAIADAFNAAWTFLGFQELLE